MAISLISGSPELGAPMSSSIERVPNPVLSNDWPSGLLQRLVVYVLITTVFTMILVNYSMRHGRLAIGPTDDDCVYLVDALQRLDILHQTPKQFVKNLYAYPPHSLFSTALGVFAIPPGSRRSVSEGHSSRGPAGAPLG
jgi:hypothetical protein